MHRSPERLCLGRAQRPGVIGGSNEDVASWSLDRRVVEAAKMATPKLPTAMQAEFAALFTGESLMLMTAVFGAWAASHACGVGEIADLVLLFLGIAMLGTAAIQCARDLAQFLSLAVSARSRIDLDNASGYLARVVSVLGVTVFTALILKGAGRVAKGRKFPGLEKAGPKTPQASVPDRVKAPTASSPRAYEALLPVDKVLEGEGAMAQAFRKAALDDWYRNYPALEKFKKRRASHVEGTDVSLPVVRRRLTVGTEIIQYQTAGRQLGTYLAYPGTSPKELAIMANARIVRRFIVTKPFEIVESTAAPFPLGKVPGVGGPGKGLQLIMPPDWERYVRPIWGKPI